MSCLLGYTRPDRRTGPGDVINLQYNTPRYERGQCVAYTDLSVSDWRGSQAVYLLRHVPFSPGLCCEKCNRVKIQKTKD